MKFDYTVNGPVLFDLGPITASQAALQAITKEEMEAALTRHAAADTGSSLPELTIANKLSFHSSGIVRSVHESDGGLVFEIVTAPTQFATSINLSEEA